MRLGNLNNRLQVFEDDRAIDVFDASGGRFSSDPQEIFEQWEDFTAWWAASGPHEGRAFSQTELLAPVPRPRQVFAIGLNYRGHANEVGAQIPQQPVVFTKFPTCIVGPVTEASVGAGTLDWEAELVVVIGRSARNVLALDAWSHVAGLMVGQDLSCRALQGSGPVPQQWSLAKSLPGYGPTGPWMVTPDALDDPNDLEIGCKVNGKVVQQSRTSDLIFPVAELVAYLSGKLTLMPGDLIFTGTPAGVAVGRPDKPWLQPSDELVTWVSGLGELTQTITA